MAATTAAKESVCCGAKLRVWGRGRVGEGTEGCTSDERGEPSAASADGGGGGGGGRCGRMSVSTCSSARTSSSFAPRRSSSGTASMQHGSLASASLKNTAASASHFERSAQTPAGGRHEERSGCNNPGAFSGTRSSGSGRHA